MVEPKLLSDMAEGCEKLYKSYLTVVTIVRPMGMQVDTSIIIAT